MTRATAGTLRVPPAHTLIATAAILSCIGMTVQQARAQGLIELKRRFGEVMQTGEQAKALDLAVQMIGAT